MDKRITLGHLKTKTNLKKERYKTEETKSNRKSNRGCKGQFCLCPASLTCPGFNNKTVHAVHATK